MTKKEFMKDVAARAGVSVAQAEAVLAATGKVTAAVLATEGAIKVPHLVNINAKFYDARPGRNPKTGEEREVPAGFRLRVKSSAALDKAFDAEKALQSAVTE